MTTAYSKKLNPSRTPIKYANGGEISDESQWRGGYPSQSVAPMEKMAMPDMDVSMPAVRESSAKLDDAPSKSVDKDMGSMKRVSSPKASKSSPAPKENLRTTESKAGIKGGDEAPKKRRMFAESREATKRFDERTKAAAIRNREASDELKRETRRGPPANGSKPTKGGGYRKNPKTLLIERD
jgi:hypothetical protein